MKGTMKEFIVKASDPDGKDVVTLVKAESEFKAVEEIRQQGLKAYQVEEYQEQPEGPPQQQGGGLIAVIAAVVGIVASSLAALFFLANGNHFASIVAGLAGIVSVLCWVAACVASTKVWELTKSFWLFFCSVGRMGKTICYETANAKEPSSPVNAKEPSSPATPKQIAFLDYMGIRDAQRLSFDEASATIDGLFETVDFNLYERRIERQRAWVTERFVLYPDLYGYEIQRMLDEELPEILHTYVRARMVGASEKLTKAKIKEVIRSLQEESAMWWQTKDKNEIFYRRLSELFPGCVDGRPPQTAQESESAAKTRKCPFCAEVIQAEAIKCKHCREFLDGRGQFAVPAKLSPTPQRVIHQNETVVVEQTGKAIKAQIVLSTFFLLVSLFLLFVNPAFLLLTILSLFWLISAKIAAWWKHG